MSTLRNQLHEFKNSTFLYASIMKFASEVDLPYWQEDFAELLEKGVIEVSTINSLGTVYKLSDTIPTWTFSSSTEAYDETQCNTCIRTGDLLHIPSEKTVGIADTWPITITSAECDLHIPIDGMSLVQLDDAMNKYSQERTDYFPSFKAAVDLARKEGYPILDNFKDDFVSTYIDIQEHKTIDIKVLHTYPSLTVKSYSFTTNELSIEIHTLLKQYVKGDLNVITDIKKVQNFLLSTGYGLSNCIILEVSDLQE